MLSVTNLSRPGLAPLSFELGLGECVAVRGPSGSGKTLMLRALTDLDPNEGDVVLGGRARKDFSGTAWRLAVGYLPAEPGWWSDRLGDHFDPAPSAAELGSLNIEERVLETPVPQLSTGERQRLALLRMLRLQPDVLLLDEPTAALDSDATLAVEALIRERMASGTAVLWVSHDAAQAERMTSRQFHLGAEGFREERL